ncbi:MAG: hypothetical protein ACI92G_001744, partial [Candidatus Pelagisphaera sp.]
FVQPVGGKIQQPNLKAFRRLTCIITLISL